MNMSFNKYFIYKSIAAAAVSALAFASCMQMEGDSDEAVGYLCAPTLDVDVSVEDLIETKALEGFSVSAPASSDFHYVVKDKDGAVKYDAVGFWEPLAMPVGTYSVEAYYGENAFGAPYFYGNTPADASIGSLEQETPALTAHIQNAVVKVSVDSDFAQHFTLENVTLTSGTLPSVTLSAAEIADWYFVPSGSELTMVLSGKSSAGVTKEYTHRITPAPKSANDIVCRQDGNNVPSVNLPDQTAGAWATRLYVTPAAFTNISLSNQALVVYEILKSGNWEKADVISEASSDEPSYQVFKNLENGRSYTVRARVGNVISNEVSVTVQENLPGTSVSLSLDKPDGVLSGTNVSLNFNLTDILNKLVDKGYLEVSPVLVKDGGTVVRTAPASGNTMAVVNNYPYLPHQSAYTLQIGHKLLDGTDAGVTSYLSASAPAPEFSINLTSYSSYDKYLEYKDRADDKALSKANEMNAYTIEGMGVSWTISAELISNGNYSKNLTYQGSVVADISGTSYAAADVTGLAVGTDYGVSAKLVFDGVEETASKTHHITGLPYFIDITTANPSGWSLYNTDFENGRLVLSANKTDSKRGYAISPRYSLPDEIDIKYKMVGYFYCTLVNASACKIWVEPTNDNSTKSQASAGHTSNKGNLSLPVTHGGNPYEGNAVLTPEKPYMCVSQNCSTATLQTRKVYFYSLELKYR